MSGIGDVQAWADGFGDWHVRVETHGVGNDDAAYKAAETRLREELAMHEGPGFAPERVSVTLNRRMSQHGVLTFYFDEEYVPDAE